MFSRWRWRPLLLAGLLVGSTGTAAPPPALTLADLEQQALRGNPTLAQIASDVEVAQGRALQSGLYPNPTVGYIGEQMGQRGKAVLGEQQGLFIDQTFITAGKLQLNRARDNQEIARKDAQALAQQYRVLNGVRDRFYHMLAMQRLLDVRLDLVKIAQQAVTTTEELVNVGAASKPDLLQARIEARQERITLDNAGFLNRAAWQELAAFVGNPSLAPTRLQGDLESAANVPEFDAALTHLLEASPEILAAHAEISRNELALRREQVEPVPDVQFRASSGYDFEPEVRRVVASMQVGFRLPLFDRNQGNIRAAEARLAHAHAEVARVELSLRQRLADQYARYRTAKALVESYRKESLPEAKQAYELYLDSFRKRRAAWPQVLVAQRTYFQMSIEYVEALAKLRRAEVAILGLLLVDEPDVERGLITHP